MVPESGIERRPNLRSVKIAQHRGGIGEARYAYAPGRSSAVFLFGRMGHWNRGRDCKPAHLTACLLGVEASSLSRTEHKPRLGCQPLPRWGSDLILVCTVSPSFEREPPSYA